MATTDAAKAGGSDPAQYSWTALTVDGFDQAYRIDAASEESPARYMLSNKATKLSLDTDQWLSLTYIQATRRTVAFAQSELLDIPDQPILAVAHTIAFEEGMIAPVGGSSLTVIGGARLVSKQTIAVSGKRLRLQLVFPARPRSRRLPAAVRSRLLPGTISFSTHGRRRSRRASRC